MEKLIKVSKVLNEVRSISSTNAKQEILKRAEKEAPDGITLRKVLYYTYNPFLMFGLTDKTLQVTSPIQPITPQMMTYVKVTEDDVFKLLEKLASNNINDSLRAEAKRLLMCIEDVDTRQMVRGILVKDLKIGVNAATLNKVFGKNFIPKFDVQLAESYSKQKPGALDGKRIWVTQKLDGFRIVYDPTTKTFYTRKGQPYEGLEHLIEGCDRLCERLKQYFDEEVVLDGELVHVPVEDLNSQELYALTSSVARKKGKHKDKAKLQFNVFDAVSLKEFKHGLTRLKYSARRNALDLVFIQESYRNVVKVPVLYDGIYEEEIIVTLLKQVEAQGLEGLMINLDGSYECKRTKKLLKVKSFKDADVLVTNIVEGTGKNIGKLGNVVVKFLHEGQEMCCEVGSGFNDEEREYYWNNPHELIGKVVEIKFFEVTQNQKDATKYSLRFPTWQGRIRNDKGVEDITDVATV